MNVVDIFQQYMTHLLGGYRTRARDTIFSAHDRGFAAARILSQIIFPAMEQIQKLHECQLLYRVEFQTCLLYLMVRLLSM